MFLPILNYQDGYGLTYGVRTTFPHAIDDQTRVSVPLSWGGERRAGVEVDHWFGGSRGFYGIGRRDPKVRLIGGFAIYRRENPYYEVSDIRLEAKARAEHPINSWLRVGATAKTAQVTFGNDRPGPDRCHRGVQLTTAPAAAPVERHTSYSADVVVDTRLDPTFPRNAVYASLGRERLQWEGDGSAGRWNTDARGYIGVAAPGWWSRCARSSARRTSALPAIGAAAARRHRHAARLRRRLVRRRQPRHRVHRTAHPADDATELRPLRREGLRRLGHDLGERLALRDADWQRGIGGGVYFGAGPLLLDLAAAWARGRQRAGELRAGGQFLVTGWCTHRSRRDGHDGTKENTAEQELMPYVLSVVSVVSVVVYFS